MSSDAQIESIIKFWFEENGYDEWFSKNDDFDTAVKTRFQPWVEKALAARLDSWAENKMGLLALILLLDQMPRNIYRNTPKAFAGDDMALALSLKGQAEGYLAEFTDFAHRLFLLIPMMHSEDLAIQNASLPLFQKYTNPDAYDYAVAHRDIIARFGHFPHRSPILGRPLSAEEEEFLKTPNSSF